MFILLFLLSLSTWSAELKVLSLNLHGLHPMGEERRIRMNEDGTEALVWSNLFYFTADELNRGLERRQQRLARDLSELRADIIFLQEIAGEKGCERYYQQNTGLDLSRRLTGYLHHPGCRGNIGWWTDSNTFSKFKIRTEHSQKIIFAPGDNPYPSGLITEGLSILTSPKVIVLDHQNKMIRINQKNETFFFQFIKFSTQEKKDQWWVAVNIHGGHKVQNFEQAVALRHFLTSYVNNAQDAKSFAGFIIGGDFNAYSVKEEVSLTPFSFDYRWQTPDLLKNDLMRLNFSNYKPSNTIANPEAQQRVNDSVNGLFDWFALNRNSQDQSLKEVLFNSPCIKTHPKFSPFCLWKEKIDHIYVSPGIQVRNHTGIYQQNNWTNLQDTLSDHPGLITNLDI